MHYALCALPSALFTKSGWDRKSGGAPALAAAAAGLILLGFAPLARADDPVSSAAALSPGSSVPVRVVVEGMRGSVAAPDLRALLTQPQTSPKGPEVRLDGALFAGLATAGLVVAERPDSDAPAPRPAAGLSPRLLRGGGVACDVRVSF